MQPEEFYTELAVKGIQLSEGQKSQFEKYFELLVEWNEKINLTAITEKSEVYLKHFYDSIAPLLLVENFGQTEVTLCDVGAGAGFPSIPLKIVFPKIKVTIVDSLNKRIKFLEILQKELALENVAFYHDRAETFGQNKDFRETFDYVTARAVARLNLLAEFCLPLVKKDGFFIALKASKTEEELSEAKKAIALLGGKFIQDIAYELPITGDERHLLMIQKKKETPKKYPRKPGTPAKQPIV